MQNRTKIIVIFTIVVAGVFTTLCIISNKKESYLWDKIMCEFYDVLLTTDTQYAEGYSAEKFDAVKIGMNEKEVLAILGEPLVRWPYDLSDKNRISFCYSQSPGDTHYKQRSIYLENGIVVQKEYSFYLD